MKKFLNVLTLAWKPNEARLGFLNQVPSRGARYQANIKWVMPEKRKFYDPKRSGDLVQMQPLNPDSLYLPFRKSKELENADEKVKKIFSLGYQKPRFLLEAYKNDLMDKVRNHPHDTSSAEVNIARLTAIIRFHHSTISQRPRKHGPLRKLVHRVIKERKNLLTHLRNKDYKKFEWLLDKLDLEYRPGVAKEDREITRKKSLELLAKLQVENIKEERLAVLKKSYDEQKVSFLEKKIKKLKEIKEIEEKNNMSPTVTDKDIEDCVKKIEEVKVEVAERLKRGYKRKIHPYFLEAYDERLLLKNEKAGESIREQGA